MARISSSTRRRNARKFWARVELFFAVGLGGISVISLGFILSAVFANAAIKWGIF